MKIESKEDLFVAWLSEIYSAEKQVADILPKIIEEATNPELKDMLRAHLRETEKQVVRLDEIFKILNCEIEDKKCDGMKGLVLEANSLILRVKDRTVLDSALIAVTQKIERYEIFCYETLCTLGEALNHEGALMLLRRTLVEEKAADEKLHAITFGLSAWGVAPPRHGYEGSEIPL